jgi:hypothetical protein
MRRVACVHVLIVGLLSCTAAPVRADPPKRPSVEFALLTSVDYVVRFNTGAPPCDTIYDYCRFDPNAGYTAVTSPVVAPGLRISFWSTHPILIDLAMSWMRVRDDDHHVSEEVMFELGASADIARRRSIEHPFAGVLAGVVVFDDQATPYLGAQLGVKHFIRDYAALRLQLGYRTTLAKNRRDLRAIEAAAGIGFFL